MALENSKTDPSFSIVVRLKLQNDLDVLSRVINLVHEQNGAIGAIDVVSAEADHMVRDISIETTSYEAGRTIAEMLGGLEGCKVLHLSDRTFLIHLGGKIEVTNKIPIKNREQLSRAYTPGVGRVCMAIHEDKTKAYQLTIKKNMVAIVSDGTAVLGLGDIGPEAAMPVMEGKAMLFKEFGNVDAFPICLDTKDTDEIVRVVKAIAPGFGGINLEDISAPRCFEIERRLQEELDIPVFHDDQHGTAVVLVAGFINALKVVGKEAGEVKVVVSGVGAAGTACSEMLATIGVKNIIGCDRQGTIYRGRQGLNSDKAAYADWTNPTNLQGSLSDALVGADVFIGLSAPGLLKVEDIKKMAKDPIVFAMANPIPEIMPEETQGIVAVMATGRSDYPNQINNVLCFPGLFRGALDSYACCINEQMKMAAAQAIAASIRTERPVADYIVPSVFNRHVAENVAAAVFKAAVESGVARQYKHQ
ncbi:MAG: NAD-dependent malic enzyme [bacterium]|nr:NAD-dependent malic enzyme [bacterium]